MGNKRRRGADSQGAVERPADPDTPEVAENVDAMVGILRDLLEAESSRNLSFDSRGVGLAGFVGIVVSLTTTLGKDALGTQLVGLWTPLAVGLFVAAVGLLSISVAFIVIGVLLPKEQVSLQYDEVARFPLSENVFRPKVHTQGRYLWGLVEMLGVERQRNNAKAVQLRRGLISLLLGLGMIVLLALVSGLGAANVIHHERGRTTGSTTAAGPSGGPSGGVGADRGDRRSGDRAVTVRKARDGVRPTSP